MYARGMSNPSSSTMGSNLLMTALEGASYANKLMTPVRTYMQRIDQWANFAAGISDAEKALHDGGRRVFTSVRPAYLPTGATKSVPIPMTDIKNGLWDTQITQAWTRLYTNMTWTTGGRPADIVFAFNHEIGSGASLAGQSSTDVLNFNAAWEHIRALHDAVMNNVAINPSGTRRVTFVVIYTLFNISQGACDKFIPKASSWDGIGVDFYNQGGYNNDPVGTFKTAQYLQPVDLFATSVPTASGGGSVLDWVNRKTAGKWWCVPEFNVVHKPTDVTASATWMTNAHTFFKAQGSAFLFALYWLNNSGGQSPSWFADYALRPGAATGTSDKNKYTAWLAMVTDSTTDVVAANAPTISTGQPTAVTSSSASISVVPPTQKTDSTSLTDLASIQMFRDGTASTIITGPFSGPVIFTPKGNTPGSTHVYTFKAIRTGGQVSAASAGVTVVFLSSGGTVPGNPSSAPTISNLDQFSASAVGAAISGATGYQWFLNGSTIPFADTVAPTTTISALNPDSDYTLTYLPYNAAGAAVAASPAASFHTTAGPDLTAPPIPSAPTLLVPATADLVQLTITPVSDNIVSGATTSGIRGYLIARGTSTNPATATLLTVDDSGNPLPSAATSYTDQDPPTSTQSSVSAYYFVAAADNAGNVSAYSTPLAVTIPQLIQANPVPISNIPDQVTVNTPFVADASSSTPGTDGSPLTFYQWDFGDGTVVATSSPTVQHAYPLFREYDVTLTVMDAAGRSAIATDTVVALPVDGGIFQSGAPKMIPNAEITAAVFNVADGYREAQLGQHDAAITQAFRVLNAGDVVMWRTGTETWTPPTTIGEFQASDRRRIPYNFAGKTQFRMFVGVGTAGHAGSKLGCQFSVDGGTTWQNLDASVATALGGEAVAVDTLGSVQGPWITLTDATAQDVLIRLATGAGDGTTAAATFLIGFQVKP